MIEENLKSGMFFEIDGDEGHTILLLEFNAHPIPIYNGWQVYNLLEQKIEFESPQYICRNGEFIGNLKV